MSGNYGLQVIFNGSIEAAEAAVTEALKNVGFGVLTRIDVAATLKKKLDLDRRPYVILGACNPVIAAQALDIEEPLGLLLPCNVIVYENAEHQTMIAAIDPEVMLSVVGNDELDAAASQVKALLQQALQAVA